MTPPGTAIFVDGMGRTRPRLVPLKDGRPSSFVQIQRDPKMVHLRLERPNPRDVVAFSLLPFSRDLLSLPDGRLVYGYQFAEGGQLKLWRASSVYNDAQDGLAEASKRIIADRIDALLADAWPPYVRLVDHLTTIETGEMRREVIGVFRERVA